MISAHVRTEKHFCSNLSAVNISVSSSFNATTYGAVLWLELFRNFSSKLVCPYVSCSPLVSSSTYLSKLSSYCAYVVLWLTSTLKTILELVYLYIDTHLAPTMGYVRAGLKKSANVIESIGWNSCWISCW